MKHFIRLGFVVCVFTILVYFLVFVATRVAIFHDAHSVAKTRIAQSTRAYMQWCHNNPGLADLGDHADVCKEAAMGMNICPWSVGANAVMSQTYSCLTVSCTTVVSDFLSRSIYQLVSLVIAATFSVGTYVTVLPWIVKKCRNHNKHFPNYYGGEKYKLDKIA